jgi:hypothetical protein
MKEIMARGPNFIYTQEFIKRTYGEATWNTLLDSLPEGAAKVWKNPLLITGTYPFSAFKAMVSMLSSTINSMTEQQTASLYEYIADRSLSTVYKVFFRFANPAFVLKNYPKLWERFFTSGTVEVPTAQREYAVLRFSLPDIFLDWLPPACYGYSKKAVEMAGGNNLRIKEQAKTRSANGLWNISYELFWDE